MERQGHAPSQAARFAAGVLHWLRMLVGLFLLGLILVLLFPVTAKRSRETLENRPAPSLGVGALLLVAVPVASVLVIILGALIGGWWIGLFLLALYFIALALGLPVAGVTVGDWIGKRLHRRIHPLLALFVGLLALTLIAQVPVLGPIVAFAAVVFGVGALFLSLVRPRPTQVVQAPGQVS